MYDIISNIIDHKWITQGASEQQYIYFIVSAIIIILTVSFIDLINQFFKNLWGRR